MGGTIRVQSTGGKDRCSEWIVEDKKANWFLWLLLDAGFQVQVAEDGAQRIETFRTWPPLIWMDVRRFR